MDKVKIYLQELGFSLSEISNAKPQEKLRLISEYYNFGPLPRFNNKQSKKILIEFVESESKNLETFSRIYESYLIKKYGIPPGMDAHDLVICNLPSHKFYKTPEWRSLRYKALLTFGNKCFACGRTPKNGVCIHVDHILPRSINPELSLSINNLQILCEDCNLAKSNTDTTNWMDK